MRATGGAGWQAICDDLLQLVRRLGLARTVSRRYHGICPRGSARDFPAGLRSLSPAGLVPSFSDFDTIMHIDPTVSPAAPAAELRRSWIAPSVQALGNMRELTLLSNHTIVFECPVDDPFCETP